MVNFLIFEPYLAMYLSYVRHLSTNDENICFTATFSTMERCMCATLSTLESCEFATFQHDFRQALTAIDPFFTVI